MTPVIGNQFRDAPGFGSVPNRAVYNVSEASILLGGVTERFVWHLVSTGAIESVKVGRRRLIPAEAIAEYILRLRSDEQRAREAARGVA